MVRAATSSIHVLSPDACLLSSPGRFFAANELKTMLAHILLNYDVKFEDGAGFPPHKYFGVSCVPQKVNLLFRKRDD
jgi:hypothetical protein